MDPSNIPAYANFSCELRIIQARNIEFIKSTKNLFARLYLPIGNNKTIQLNTKNVSSKFWDESFNLDCSCPTEFLKNLKQQSLVLELRQKKTWGSRIVGKGEIPWKVILESQNMELKKWLKMDLVSGSDCKMFTTPEVEVEIKLKVASIAQMEKQNKKMLNKWNECGCQNDHDHRAWCNAEDCDMFAFGAALEAY